MRVNFSYTTSALWGAVALSVTVAIRDNFSWPSLVFFGSIIAALSYWLAKNRKEFRTRYEAAEAAAAVPGPYDNQIWRHKPMLRDMAPALAVMGLISFYFAYIAAHGDPPTKIAKLIHQLFGVPGVVAFWALLGIIMFAKATESIIGSRVKK